ncbi:hypothetical protein P152DRAFT_460800 [Eremomyces bilateralis CBS 781.70]|uniref:Zn(2)-C6 fungal-type domain-containing protein n=1 Tax=Eremomyces bilateralis CBS 781.70 TaxID=1392243 RepID=A0A6G1FWX9_9PEZI|nr:uncharacterized protein P152DRAFT_460800 [Eremomyces bilateralis CBS 781.70]KAF1810293.1 hypothetical protein P152DRAFT_460800 [Eremomyces bilateralis CBS 781.70]
MSRPQVGIDRLPARRMSNEPRESMNCKSCRKRKIKCNRMRPTCEACQIFACQCVYDAIPKKRGPKTDVLEALLKRVDGLEKRLQTEESEKQEEEPVSSNESAVDNVVQDSSHGAANDQAGATANHKSSEPEQPHSNNIPPLIPPEGNSQPPPSIYPEVLVDAYFAQLHGKPYYILDELSTRQKIQLKQLPNPLAYAIYAVSARYASHVGGYANAVRVSIDFAKKARLELDVDEPSIESLQALLLLSLASYQNGRGKKAYMLLSSAITMALALGLHRELPSTMRIPATEREGRRRLFWACYLLDRFGACGSRRPSLIADESIVLRLPSWQLHPSGMTIEGDYFSTGSNLQYLRSGKQSHGGSGMLIGITRILGVTNRYLANGGVKGDSHFPWHSLSNLSKIRQDLDMWASETQDVFASLETLFGQPDSTILVLSKLVYHLIHCLIYRPFLPIDLTELSGNSQHQSWQIEATNMCFLHANAISELVEIGKASTLIEWPEFIGYCVSTAGMIHVHGTHYRGGEGGDRTVFAGSPEFLSREMQQLSELRSIWAGVQHQCDMLQAIYNCHIELVKSLASNPLRFSSVFHLEGFFDRYPGRMFDGSHLSFVEIQVDPMAFESTMSPYGLNNQGFVNMALGSNGSMIHQQQQYFPPQRQVSASVPQGGRKRRRTTTSNPTKPSPPLSAAAIPSNSKKQPQDTSGTQPFMSELPPPNQTLSSSETKPPPSQQPNPSGPIFSPNFSFSPLQPTNFPNPTNNATNPSQPSSTNNYNNNGPSYRFPDQLLSLPFDGSTSTDPSGQPILGYEASGTNTMSNSAFVSMPGPSDMQTPGSSSAVSGGGTSGSAEGEKDPFLSLLEQLAESEGPDGGGLDLDFFLAGGNA